MKSPRSDGVLLVIVSAGFVALGIVVGDRVPWYATGFFAVCLVIGVLVLFGVLPKEPAPTDKLTIDDIGITRTDGRLREHVAWADVQRVRILTNDRGPYGEDVFFVIDGKSGAGCVVPHDLAVRGKLLDALQARLEGLSNAAVIEAMGSTENREFTIWESALALDPTSRPMPATTNDTAFSGSIPETYEKFAVPLLFAPYAEDLARRLAKRPPNRILEIAAGTGVVTRALAAALPASTSIVATDLNQAMLDYAASVPIARAVDWRQADAMKLPFGDNVFDAVVIQFGVMFFPDKPRALAEVRRVLQPGGTLVYTVWDRLEENEVPDLVTQAMKEVFPGSPTSFFARVPHAYFERDVLARDLATAGFAKAVQIDTVTVRGRSTSPLAAATGCCQGTPLRNEIEAHSGERLREATDAAAALIAKRFGTGAVDSKLQAHIVTVEK